MIKSIITILTSGILLNPMILLGIAVGFFLMYNLEYSEIHELFKNPNFYGSLAIVAVLYVLLLKRVYYRGGVRINWKATLSECLYQFFLFLFSIIFSCLFIFTFSFGTNDESIETID